MLTTVGLLLSLSLPSLAAAPTYSATYLPSNLPDHTEEGQTGTNRCGTVANQTSMCQNAYMNAVDDWCVWAPPQPGPGSGIGETERVEVSWCLKDGYGTRLIPDGAVTGAHWIVTPDFVQVTGAVDMTKLNVPAGDEGGELDPHGADGNGNPVGGVVFSSAFGQLQQIFEWTNFMDGQLFCFRACNPKGPNAPGYCQHIYDVMGCQWNMPGNYDAGFTSCQADSGEPMGVYGGSTWHQGDGATPAAHPAPATRACTTLSTVGNGQAVQTSGPASGLSSVPAPTGGPSGRSTGVAPSGSKATSSSRPNPSASGGAPNLAVRGAGLDFTFLSTAFVVVSAFVGALMVL
ncbi:hypothetical protein MIND_00666500 [Mycena indigotica]|uniref:Macrofage activating glycoprotein n=1 Tax=Mycena indigotica TaxID=2126181 RepID=A0A8H6SLI2_9AGAR|nr:uncharacterized protein MIND_00666500 [Mycena indigotica]KAF7301027.1 hypothetical protein MIND_00666500 [Mycena indigotica]